MFSRLTSFLTASSQPNSNNNKNAPAEVVEEPFMQLEDGHVSTSEEETTEEEELAMEVVPTVKTPEMPTLKEESTLNKFMQRRIEHLQQLQEANQLLSVFQGDDVLKKAIDRFEAACKAIEEDTDEEDIPDLVSDTDEEDHDPEPVDLGRAMMRKAAYFYQVRGNEFKGVCEETGSTLPAEAFENYDPPYDLDEEEEEECSEQCACDDCIVEISEAEEEWLCGECGNTLFINEAAWLCGECGSVWVLDEDEMDPDYPYDIVEEEEEEEIEFYDNPAYDPSEEIVPVEVEDDLHSTASSSIEEEWDTEDISSNDDDDDWDETEDEETGPPDDYEDRIEGLLKEMWQDAERTAAAAVQRASASCASAHEVVDKILRSVYEGVSFDYDDIEDKVDDFEDKVDNFEVAALDTDVCVEPNPFEMPIVDTDVEWLPFQDSIEPTWSSGNFNFEWSAANEMPPFPPQRGCDTCSGREQGVCGNACAGDDRQPWWGLPTTDQLDWPPTRSIFDDIATQQHTRVHLEPSLDELISMCDDALRESAARIEKLKLE